MTYRINSDMLRKLREAVGLRGDITFIKTSVSGPPTRVNLEEIARLGDETIQDLKFTPKTFGQFMAFTGFNSNAFRATFDGNQFTFGRISGDEEIAKFAKWAVEKKLVDDASEITDNPKVLGDLRFAWPGLVWRLENDGFFDLRRAPDPDYFIAPGTGNELRRRMIYKVADSMTEVDGSSLDDEPPATEEVLDGETGAGLSS